MLVVAGVRHAFLDAVLKQSSEHLHVRSCPQNRVHPSFIGPYIHLTVCSNRFTNEQESVALADRFQFYRTPVPSALPFLSGDKARGVFFMDLVYVRNNYTVSNSPNRVIRIVHVG
jgi:hypothetical protein